MNYLYLYSASKIIRELKKEQLEAMKLAVKQKLDPKTIKLVLEAVSYGVAGRYS